MSDDVPAITHKTRFSAPLSALVAGAVGLLGAAWAVFGGYTNIQWSLRTFGERLIQIDAKLGNYDPAAVTATCKRTLVEELGTMVIECPRSVRRGETVGPCRVVFPAARKE